MICSISKKRKWYSTLEGLIEREKEKNREHFFLFIFLFDFLNKVSIFKSRETSNVGASKLPFFTTRLSTQAKRGEPRSYIAFKKNLHLSCILIF